MTGSLLTFSASPLAPAFPKPEPIWESFQFGASQAIAKGTVVAIKTSDGKVYPYVASTLVTPPTTPTFVAAGAGGSWPTGIYTVAVAFLNPQGETTPCPAVFLSVTLGQNIRVPAITGIDATVTKTRVYVNGFLAAEINVAATATVQTDIANFSGALAGIAQQATNTAKNVTSGLQQPIGVTAVDVTSDSTGRLMLGLNTPGEFGQTYNDAPIFLKGYFLTADLTGLDAYAVSQLGRLTWGSVTTGILNIT